MKKILFSLFIYLTVFSNCLAAEPTKLSELMESFKTSQKESIYNTELNAPFSKSSSGVKESVDNETGAVTVTREIYNIPGVNGLNLSLAINYNSNDARVYVESTSSERIPNNYGDVVAYYEVYDKKGNWLNTQGLRYLAGHEYIEKEQELDGKDWKFNGKLYKDDKLLTSELIQNYSRDKNELEQNRSILGEGWTFDIPYVDVSDENTPFVKLVGGSVYSYDSKSACGLKDYELNDIVFRKETNGGFLLSYSDGMKYYFSKDGNLTIVSDKHGNKLNYVWEDKKLIKVSDDIGRIISISYSGSGISFRYGNQEIKLVKEKVLGTNSYYLTKIIDQKDRVVDYTYKTEVSEYDIAGKGLGHNKYINLINIRYPTGLNTAYEYSSSYKRLGEKGYTKYYRVSKRYELIDGEKYNYMRYSYGGQPDGYPNNENDKSYIYNTNINKSNGIREEYIYNAEHQEIEINVYLDGKRKEKIVKNYHKTQNTPIRVVTTNYDRGKRTLVNEYKYDRYGNTIEENTPLDEKDIKQDSYKTFYRYDYTYNMPVYKKYKQDEDTVVEFINILTDDNKNIKEEKVLDNGTVKKHVRYEYDSHGNCIKEYELVDGSEWIEKVYTYTNNLYPSTASIKGIKDADGNTKVSRVETKYDLHTGYVLEEIDANGNSTKYEYDILGRKVKEILPDKATRVVKYDDENNIITTTDANFNRLIYYFDKLGKLKEVIEPKSTIRLIKYKYDNDERLLSETDANNNVKYYSYDDFDRIEEIKWVDSKKKILKQREVEYGINKKNINYVEITDLGDNDDYIKTYYFDDFDRITNIVIENGNNDLETKYFYDFVGNKIEVEDFDKEEIKLEYDIFANVISKTDKKGNVEKIKYDRQGKVVENEDALGRKRYTSYDYLGREIVSRVPYKGNEYAESKKYYDLNGNLLKVIDAEGGIFKRYYNNRNALTATELVINSKKSYINKYIYDKELKLVKMQKGLNSFRDNNYTELEYVYDSLGRVVTSKDESGNETKYKYDNNGNLLELIDRNGISKFSTYDGLNREVVKYNTKDNDKLRTHYNLLGQIEKLESDSDLIEYTYNKQGKVKTIKNNGQINSNYNYDELGRITNYSVKRNKESLIDIDYDYDLNNNVVSVIDDKTKVIYEYDKLNRPVRDVNKTTGIETTYSYYNFGGVKSLIHKNGEKIENALAFEYDRVGNKIKEMGNGNVKTYYYDTLSRLQAMEDIKGNIQSYKYDDFNNISFMVDISNGKIEESKYSYDINNRLILKESDIKELNTQHRMEYDREGNLIKKEEALREGNEFIGSKTFEYNYDGYNRLSIVKDPMKRFTEYSYNNLGLRSNKKIGNEEINYLYNGDQIVLETYKDGLIKAKNIRGRNLIYRQVNEKELYYLHNERGDVIKLLDDKGSLVKNYEYDPYGNEDITNKHQDRNIDNPFRYAGEYLDEETGNYYLRARYYNPEIQRFISEDQVKGNNTNPLTYNLYGYCEGNPIRYVDTSGNYPIYSLYPQVGARGSKIQEIVDRKVRKEEVGIEYSVKKTAVGMYYISSETTSIGLSFSPVGDIKDIQEAVTGVDLVTGEKLEADERAITIVAAALPWINAKAARMALKLNKGIKRVTKIGKKTRNFVNIKNKVLGNIRTGSALKLDAQHAFDDIVDNYATYADKFELIGGDGVKRELYQIEGSFNGKKGIFEWVVDSDKKKGVTHRRFIDGVGITGKPNARSKK